MDEAKPSSRKGLTLRFDSVNALLALVAQRRVSVYGWLRDGTWRLASERGVLSFAPSPSPRRFHNMRPDTVPRSIVDAFQSASPDVSTDTATWGVTLPADTQRQLERLVDEHGSGTLIIEATGRVRLEPAG